MINDRIGLQVRIEGDRWVAESSVLGVSAYGRTEDEAKAALVESLKSGARMRGSDATREASTAAAADPPPPNFRALSRTVLRALRLVGQTGQQHSLTAMALVVLAALSLPVQIVLAKYLADAVLRHPHDAIAHAVPYMTAMFALGVFYGTVQVVRRERNWLLTDAVARNAEASILARVAELELASFEDSTFFDKFYRAQQEAKIRPWILVMNTTELAAATFTLLALLAVLAYLNPLLCIPLLLAYVPMLTSNLQTSRMRYFTRLRNTPADRELTYISSLLTERDAAKEIRMLDLGSFLVDRFRDTAAAKRDDLSRTAKANIRSSCVATLKTSVLVGGGLALITLLYAQEHIGLTAFATGVAAYLIAGTRVGVFLRTANGLYEAALFIDDFWSLLDETPGGAMDGRSPTIEPPLAICFDDVNFEYPGAAAFGLRNISMALEPGRVLALVGENGSGKTTFVKLLCGLYRPSGGRICINGEEFSAIPPSIRKYLTVLFQDFTRYDFSVADNITFGNITRRGDVSRLVRAAELAGAREFIRGLPNGFETRLGRLFEGGAELSLGQWQRVALARALFRDSPVVILDEPTAALDARGEYELFQLTRELFTDRALVLVSHRFANVRHADEILVFDAGEIRERGDHQSLLSRRGKYAELYQEAYS